MNGFIVRRSFVKVRFLAAVKLPAARNCKLPRCGDIYERVDLTVLRSFLDHAKAKLIAEVVEVAPSKPRHGTHTSRCVDHHRDDGTVAKSNRRRRVDFAEQR